MRSLLQPSSTVRTALAFSPGGRLGVLSALCFLGAGVSLPWPPFPDIPKGSGSLWAKGLLPLQSRTGLDDTVYHLTIPVFRTEMAAEHR